jgi:hypothetical protein
LLVLRAVMGMMVQ